MSYSGVVFLVVKTTKSSYVFSNLGSYFITCVMIRALKLLEVSKESQILGAQKWPHSFLDKAR